MTAKCALARANGKKSTSIPVFTWFPQAMVARAPRPQPPHRISRYTARGYPVPSGATWVRSTTIDPKSVPLSLVDEARPCPFTTGARRPDIPSDEFRFHGCKKGERSELKHRGLRAGRHRKFTLPPSRRCMLPEYQNTPPAPPFSLHRESTPASSERSRVETP